MKCSIRKWQCRYCLAQVMDNELLRAPNPFDLEDNITGCPKCKSVEGFDEVCDEVGCNALATCGTPEKDEYRRVCGKHYRLIK